MLFARGGGGAWVRACTVRYTCEQGSRGETWRGGTNVQEAGRWKEPATEDLNKKSFDLSDVGQQGKSMCWEAVTPCTTLEIVGPVP